MAGFWAGRGVFRLRADDTRVGQFLALALGVAAAAVAFLVLQATVGLPALDVEGAGQLADNQLPFVAISFALVAFGAIVAWLSNRTVFRLTAEDLRIRTYLTVATAVAAFVLVFALVRLVVGPTGYFSAIDGSDTEFLGGANLTGLALADPLGLVLTGLLGVVLAALVWAWARRGENARLFPSGSAASRRASWRRRSRRRSQPASSAA